MYRLNGNIWTEAKDGALIGVGRMELLEKIDKLGSISAAAKSMKMSYRQAWELVDSMNKQAEAPLVETSAGGTGGGGTVITQEGRKVIKLYKELLDNFKKFKNKESNKL